MSQVAASGLLCAEQERHESRFEPMPNHLTPAELSRETGIDRRDVLAMCVEAGVPIYHGRIDKTLFEATIRERSAAEPAGPAGVQ